MKNIKDIITFKNADTTSKGVYMMALAAVLIIVIGSIGLYMMSDHGSNNNNNGSMVNDNGIVNDLGELGR